MFHQGNNIRIVSDRMLEGSSAPSRPSHPPFPSLKKIIHLGPPDPLDLNKTTQKTWNWPAIGFLVPRFVFLQASWSSGKPFCRLSKVIRPNKKRWYHPQKPHDISNMRSETILSRSPCSTIYYHLPLAGTSSLLHKTRWPIHPILPMSRCGKWTMLRDTIRTEASIDDEGTMEERMINTPKPWHRLYLNRPTERAWGGWRMCCRQLHCRAVQIHV